MSPAFSWGWVCVKKLPGRKPQLLKHLCKDERVRLEAIMDRRSDAKWLHAVPCKMFFNGAISVSNPWVARIARDSH